MVLGKIKSALASDEKIAALEEQLESLANKVEKSQEVAAKQQETMAGLLDSVKDMHKEQKKLAKTFDEQARTVEASMKQFHKVVSEMTLFKPKLEKDLVGVFEKKVQQELDTITKTIKLDASEREAALEKLSSQFDKATKIQEHIEKVHDIMKNIKATDFELSEHARNLRKADQEKLRLMKRIDQLEGILAKMKRKH